VCSTCNLEEVVRVLRDNPKFSFIKLKSELYDSTEKREIIAESGEI
jgi:hypothetical protein